MLYCSLHLTHRIEQALTSLHAYGLLYTHNHTRAFNSPLSRTTRVSWYQKGKTNLDFTEVRDSEWQWHHSAICKSAPRSRQLTTPAPHHSVFYRPDALPVAQPTASKHRRHLPNQQNSKIKYMRISRMAQNFICVEYQHFPDMICNVLAEM